MGDDLRIELKFETTLAWIDVIQSDFNTFLQDHAACERKASATGINFVVQYPDRSELQEPMILMAREELFHFQQVCSLLRKRGVTIAADARNPYVNQLLAEIRHGRDERLLDRLLVFGIMEARGTERFALLGSHLSESELRTFYQKLAEAEARHKDIFIELALRYFPYETVKKRLHELECTEAEILSKLPLRAAVH